VCLKNALSRKRYNYGNQRIVSWGCRVDYPERILEELQSKADTIAIDAVKIGKELGNERAMNIVLFGALSKSLNLDDIDWESIISSAVNLINMLI